MHSARPAVEALLARALIVGVRRRRRCGAWFEDGRRGDWWDREEEDGLVDVDVWEEGEDNGEDIGIAEEDRSTNPSKATVKNTRCIHPL